MLADQCGHLPPNHCHGTGSGEHLGIFLFSSVEFCFVSPFRDASPCHFNIDHKASEIHFLMAGIKCHYILGQKMVYENTYYVVHEATESSQRLQRGGTS